MTDNICADFKSLAKAAVMRASMGGRPESRNRVRIMTVTHERTTVRAPSSSMAGALSCGAGAGVAAGGAGDPAAAGADAGAGGPEPKLPAAFRNSPMRLMICSNGRILRSVQQTVGGGGTK